MTKYDKRRKKIHLVTCNHCGRFLCVDPPNEHPFMIDKGDALSIRSIAFVHKTLKHSEISLNFWGNRIWSGINPFVERIIVK